MASKKKETQYLDEAKTEEEFNAIMKKFKVALAKDFAEEDDDDFDLEKYIEGLLDGQVAEELDFSSCYRCREVVEKVTKHTEVVGKQEYEQLVCDICLEKIKSLALNPGKEIIECAWCCPDWEKASREPGVKGVEATHKLIRSKKDDGIDLCFKCWSRTESKEESKEEKERQALYHKKRDSYITNLLLKEKIKCFDCGSEILTSGFDDKEYIEENRNGKKTSGHFRVLFQCNSNDDNEFCGRLVVALSYALMAKYNARTFLNSDKIKHNWKKNFEMEHWPADGDMKNSDGIKVEIRSTIDEKRFKQNSVPLSTFGKQKTSNIMKVFVDKRGKTIKHKFVKKEGKKWYDVTETTIG